jgi:hypothetical protein
MDEVNRRTLNFPFRHPRMPENPSHDQFQVVLSLTAENPCSDDDLETAVMAAIEALVADARGVAMGPVGGVNFETHTLEIEFTAEAVSPAVLHAKVGEVLRILERHGFKYSGSTDQRLAPERDFELATR